MPRIAKTTRHGMRYSRAYVSWTAMKSRCLTPTDSRYADYGGRGFRVCEAWILSFVAFHADVGDPPSDKHTLDRKDPNGNYDPLNVKWSTPQEQAENTRRKRTLTFEGRTLTLKGWARETGLTYNTIFGRFHRGEPASRILDMEKRKC